MKHVYILSRNFWYVLRFIRVTFYTCNLWRILSTSATIYIRRQWSKISKVSRNISYVYEFTRWRFHTRIKSNAFEKIHVCKIPWMILHSDTRIKSYMYEKLHVGKVTRMKKKPLTNFVHFGQPYTIGRCALAMVFCDQLARRHNTHLTSGTTCINNNASGNN